MVIHAETKKGTQPQFLTRFLNLFIICKKKSLILEINFKTTEHLPNA
jgi:hypothetical protein